MNTVQLKELAQLSQAAYANFSSSSYGNNEQTEASLLESKNSPFVQTQSKQLTDKYQVLHQFTAPGLNGFSATVFRDKADPSHLILSMRGTEFEGDKLRDLLLTDMQIGLSGYARPQAVPMYRYIKQLQTTPGQPVSYSEDELQRLFYLNVGQVLDVSAPSPLLPMGHSEPSYLATVASTPAPAALCSVRARTPTSPATAWGVTWPCWRSACSRGPLTKW